MSGNSHSIWKANSDLFHRLYLQQDLRLQDVKVIAERDHNFPPTPLSTYEAKLRDELKLRKNLKPEEWAAIGRHLRSRPTQSSVFLCRVRIHEDKVKRYVRRYKKRATSDRAELPPDIRITPVSEITKTLTSNAKSHPPIPNTKPRKIQTAQAIRPLQRMPVTLSTVSSSHLSANLALDIPTEIKPLPLRPVGKCTNGFVDQVLMLLKSKYNSVSFVQFSAPILDKRFANQWAPLLDNLPVIQFQRGLSASANDFSHSSVGHYPISASDWGPDSLRSLEEIDIMDAAELGLLPHSHSQVNTDFFTLSPEISLRFECRLSTFRNPFHALSIILHCLSNNFVKSFPLKNLMDEFYQQAPESMLQMLFMIDCPTIRAAWSNFLDWTVLIDSQQLLQCLGKIILQSGIFPPQSTILSKLLSFAAWFGATDLCNSLIRQGVPLNQEHQFRTMLKGSPVSMWYDPLAAAVVRGNVSIVELLLSSGARLNIDPRDIVDSQLWTPISPLAYLLGETRKDDKFRDNRLRILAILLAAGADVYSLSALPDPGNRYNLTILDEALLSSDTVITEIFLKYLPDNYTYAFSRSGVLLAAMQGVGVLSAYLSQTSATFDEVQGREIRGDAFRWAIRKGEINAISNMITYAGSEPEGLLEQDRGAYLDISMLIEKVIECSPLTSELRKLAIYIMESHQGKDVEYELILACLRNTRDEWWRFLADYVIQKNHPDKALMISMAVRANNLGAITVLREQIPNITVDSEVWFSNRRYSILLLSSGTILTRRGAVPALKILAHSSAANVETLDFIVQNGASVASCHPRFWSEECWVEGTQLLWLLRNGLLGRGLTSIYSLLQPAMQWRNLDFSRHWKIQREIGQWLLDRSVPVFSPDEASLLKGDKDALTDLHPLSFFITLGPCPEMIDRVLESGININTRGKHPRSFTPLETAAKVGDFHTAAKLISHGANINQEGDITLQLACLRPFLIPPENANRRRETVKVFLNAGANPNKRENRCCPSPLQVASEVDVVRLLLVNGADPNENVTHCITSEHWKCQFFDQILTASLYNAIPCPVLSYFIARHSARTVDLVRTLLEGGARLAGDELRIACRVEDLHLVKLLLDWNANPNIFDPHHGPALSEAAGRGSLPMILLLMAAGAVVDPVVDDIAKSPLVAAAKSGRLDAVALLMQLETRANVIERAILEARSEEHYEVALQLHQLLQRRNSEATGMAV